METIALVLCCARCFDATFHFQNAVEEYVYDLRSKLYEELEVFVAEEERTQLSRELEETENWLYEDGEDCQKQVYVDKLDYLKVSFFIFLLFFLLLLLLFNFELFEMRDIRSKKVSCVNFSPFSSQLAIPIMFFHIC